MSEINLEKVFREAATRYVNSGIMARKFAEMSQSDGFDRDIDETSRDDTAASNYAVACEHFFKAPIMYHDMIKYSPLRSAKSVEEIEEIADQFIARPEKIQASILPSHDFRKNISLSLTTGERSTGGHDLFAYYQLQNPIFSTLINHEFLSYDGDSSFNWIDVGILTDDIINQDQGGNLLLPQQLLDSLDKNKTAFSDFRYAAMRSGIRKVQVADIDFLIEMSGGLKNVMTTLFPPLNAEQDYTESRLEHQIRSDIYSFYKPKSGVRKAIESLDIIGKFYMKNDFNKDEFEVLLNKLEEINQIKELTLDAKVIFRNVYLNLCIYLKHCSVVNDVNIPFDRGVFNRIEKYCKVIMNTNAFNKNATQLRYISMFTEKKEKLQQRLERYKETDASLKETTTNEYEEDLVNESDLEKKEEKSKTEKDNNDQNYMDNENKIPKIIFGKTANGETCFLSDLKYIKRDSRIKILKLLQGFIDSGYAHKPHLNNFLFKIKGSEGERIYAYMFPNNLVYIVGAAVKKSANENAIRLFMKHRISDIKSDYQKTINLTDSEKLQALLLDNQLLFEQICAEVTSDSKLQEEDEQNKTPKIIPLSKPNLYTSLMSSDDCLKTHREQGGSKIR